MLFVIFVRYDEMLRYGELRTQQQDFFSDLLDNRFIVDVFSDCLYEIGDLLRLLLFKTACGNSRRAYTQSIRIHRRRRVAGYCVIIRNNSGPVQGFCQFLAGNIFVSQID